MLIKMDEDLKSVAEFMQRNLPASKLVPVAEALADLERDHFTRKHIPH